MHKICMTIQQSVAAIAVAAVLAIGVALNTAKALPVVTTIDFEAVVGQGVDATAYLASFGITVSAEPNTKLFVFDETVTYGGGVVGAPSGTQYLSQEGDGTPAGNSARTPPNTFTLTFATQLDSFGFSDSAILVPSITSPWTATAYDTGNTILDTASYAGGLLHGTLLFTLNGPAIDHVTFNQTAAINAAFYAANLDDFILTTSVPEPSTLAIFALGLAGLGFMRRRRKLN